MIGGDSSRRNFLKGAFTLGGIVATSRLPLHAAAPANAGTGPVPCLSIAYGHIKAGVAEPFSVTHITDTHLSLTDDEDDAKLKKFAKYRDSLFHGRQLEALKASINFAKKKTDYLVHTGDLIDFVSNANFAAIKEAFGPEADFFCAMGNHEYWWRGEGSRSNAALFKACQEVYPNDLRFASKVVNGVNFVALNNAVMDNAKTAGITQAQIDAFKKEVEKGLPIVLLTHVPFYTPDIWMAKCKYCRTKGKFRNEHKTPMTFNARVEDFIAYLKSEPLLKGILTGHEHITVVERFSPTAMQYLTAGNYAFAVREVLIT